MVPQATQTSATIRRLPAGTSRKLAAKAAKRASAKAAYAAKRAQQQADAPPPKEVAAEAARQLLLRRQAVARYRAARRAQRRANATFDMPAVLPFRPDLAPSPASFCCITISRIIHVRVLVINSPARQTSCYLPHWPRADYTSTVGGVMRLFFIVQSAWF